MGNDEHDGHNPLADYLFGERASEDFPLRLLPIENIPEDTMMLIGQDKIVFINVYQYIFQNRCWSFG